MTHSASPEGEWGGPRYRYAGQIEIPEAHLYDYAKARAYYPSRGASCRPTLGAVWMAAG